MFVYIIKVFIL